MVDDLHRFSTLLYDFRKHVPMRPQRPPTIIEIGGNPHYENVCSNILAFFLDPDKPHGLGTLFLEALAEAGQIVDKEGLMDGVVEREVVTEARKRIDILVLSDSHAVLIENKIFAALDNPWPEYAAFLEEKQQPHKHKFLLTLTRTDTGEKQGFRNITYRELVDRIRGLLGNYAADANTRYLTFMLDFLNTLDNLRGEKVVNEEFLKFLTANRADTEDFLKVCENVKREFKSKIDTLYERLTAENVRQAHLQNVLRRKYQGEQLERVLSYTIQSGMIKNTNVKVRAAIDPSGWEIGVCLERNDPIGQAELRRALEDMNLGVPFECNGERFVFGGPDVDGFAYGADLEKNILPIMCRVVRDLAGRPLDAG